MPTIIKGSISILSDAGLGMAMFSLGTELTFCCLFITTSLYFSVSHLLQEMLTVTYAIDPGLFMALQPKIISCGKSVATFAMAVRFLTGPAVIAATSIAVGLRGVLLHVAIVQVGMESKPYHNQNLPTKHSQFNLLILMILSNVECIEIMTLFSNV